MARKKNGFTRENFETGKNNGNFIAMYHDMYDCKAWLDLTPYARDLYGFMRRKYTRKVTNGVIVESNKDNISMPKSEYTKLYKQDTFYRAIDMLIEHGFVRVIRNGRFTRQCNIYGFVDMWQYYGTDKFEVPNSWRRAPKKDK